MNIDVRTFGRALTVLQQNTLENVVDSRASVLHHLELTTEAYGKTMENLRYHVVIFKKSEAENRSRKQSIESNDIRPWVPLLKKQQLTNIYGDTKMETVKQITRARKEMDDHDLTLQELHIRVKEQARKAKEENKILDKLKRQLITLEAAIEVNAFLDSIGYMAGDIAEFEHQKYYDMYRRAGELIG